MSAPENAFPEVAADQNKVKIPLVVILGPTAVGKTTIAIQLAEKLNGEIISADSRLFYRGMDIGTAKPTQQDQLRVVHHLIDIANPDETISLGLFQQKAIKAIQNVYDHHHLPFLVGGTGQFLRSIIEGWQIPPVAPNLNLRQALHRWGMKQGADLLHEKLAILDPMAAKTIDPSNLRRTIRALEVILTTGKRFSEQKKRGHQAYDTLLVGLTLSREALYRRIDERIDRMIKTGFIEEVGHLLELGYSPDLPTFTAIGYGELIAYIQGNITLDEAIVLIKRRTRNFVRRQANWFKLTDPEIQWFDVSMNEMGNIERLIISKLKNRLSELPVKL
jgi:tRNA dimethylallyltransferase